MGYVKLLSSFSLLFVEDDILVCKILGDMIVRKFPDITLYTAENGRIGVELFKAHVPDIIITDINMPGMDGIQMASEIKALNADTKFIVLTAYSDKSHLKGFSEIGFNDHIVKPVDIRKLFAAIEKCCAEIMMH